MFIIKCIYLLLCVYCIGAVLHTRLFNRAGGESTAGRLSLVFGLGAGTLGLGVFYVSLLGGPIDFRTILLFSGVFLPLFMYDMVKKVRKGRSTITKPNGQPRQRIVQAICIAVLVVSMALVLFRALFLPMHLADDRAQWGLKAKIYYHEKTVWAEELFDAQRLIYHNAYPPMVPVLESCVYAALGEVDDATVKVLFVFFYTGVLAALYAAQKRFTTDTKALLLTVCMAMLPVFIQDVHGNPSSGYADVPLAFFYFSAIVALIRWIEKGTDRDVWLAGLLAAFTVFTKKEGLMLWGCSFVVVLPVVLKRAKGKGLFFAAYLVVPVVLLAPWFYYCAQIPVPPWEKEFSLSALRFSRLAGNLFKLPVLLEACGTLFFSTRHHGPFWFLFVLCLLSRPRNVGVFPVGFLSLLILFNTVALLFAAYIFAFPWWTGMVYDFPRLLIITIPLALLCMAYQLYGESRECNA